MNLFTNTFNYRDLRRKINQSSRTSNAFANNSGLLLAFTFLLLIVGCLPSSTNAFKIMGRDTALEGCYHNGTVYGDGSLVPTMEPCLSCQCANRTLLCSLRVCHEQPVPPPRGCVIVHHKNKCCPHMFCKRFHKRPMVSDMDRKIVNFLDEFEQEQQAIHERYEEFAGDENALRRRSEDPDSFDEFCVQNGTIYQSGSAMTTSSLCSYCYCINGKQKCVKPKCQLPQAPSHCSPVYMEGSCCPLKYDCSGNGAALNTPVTHKKTNQNKWTPKQRPDGGLSMEDFSNLPHHRRRHSCNLSGRIFVEGEKLPVDPEDPCNICYCIHGESKCTPKKCTPAMKNCIPIIPQGQCCPSGYRCNMAKPRQFDFFSILFGVDENSTEPITSQEVTTLPPFIPLAPLNVETTSEKSFFDVLRDGLNYVEKNGDHFEAAMDKTVNVTEKEEEKDEKEEKPVMEDTVAVVTVTESTSDEYFDYEDNDPDDDEIFPPNEQVIKVSHSQTAEKKETKVEVPSTTTTTTTTTTSTTTRRPTTTTTQKPTSTTIKAPPKTTRRPPVTPKPTQELEISTIKFIPSPTRVVNLATQKPPRDSQVKQDAPFAQNQMTSNSSVSQNLNPNTESLFSAFFSGLAEIFDEKFKQNATRNGTTMTPTEFTVATTMRPMTIPPSHKPQFYVTPSSIRPVPIIREEIRPIPIEYTTKAPTTTTTKKVPVTTSSTTRRPSPSTTTTASTTTQAPTKKTPQPTAAPMKPETTSTTTKAPTTVSTTSKPVTKPSSTTKIPSTTVIPEWKKKNNEITYSTQTEKVSLLTAKPLAIPPTVNKPGMVEDSDYHFDYNDPTLPPSLPNLKIIPFLPADAVKHDRQKPYDYYNLERTSYPSITTDAYDSVHGQYELGEKTIDYSNSYVKEQLSHDIIKKGDGFKYPSITEPTDVIMGDKMEDDKSDYDYLLDGYNLKKNGYADDYMKNNYDVDVNSYMSFKSGPVYKKGSSSSVNLNRVEPVATAEITNVNVELRTEAPEFNFDLNRFSPPKETEGGFQPRNPERFYNKYESSKHPIDITTDQPEEELTGYNAIKNKYFPAKKKAPVDPNTISITTDRNIPEIKEIVDTLMPDVIRQSDDTPQDSIPNFDVSKDPENDGIFGDLFSMLFKDEEPKPSPKPEVNLKTKLETSKDKFSGVDIPPFKSISPSFSKVELTTKKQQQRPEQPSHLEDPLNVDVGVFDDQNQHGQENENGTAIKNILLDLLGHGHNPFDHASTVSTPPATPAPPPSPSPQPKQPLKFPVHSIPYIASNLHINPRPLEPIRNNLDSLLTESSKGAGQKYGQVLADDLNLATYSQADYVVNPLNLDTLKRHQSDKPAKIYSKPLANKNDMGMLLKLAGCNIYGRMYRVGRIISELSGPCLQCMCEEVGVHCTPLEC